jgi:GDP-L-fucose synthase
MDRNARILVTGGRGLVGSAICRHLRASGFTDVVAHRRTDCDLTRQTETEHYLRDTRPDYVIVAAARVGGIHANSTYPAAFAYDNLMIAGNLIHSAHLIGVRKLVYLGSSCVYPRLAPQPIPEDALLSSPLEPTNEAYAIAKIAGLKMCEFYTRQYDCNFVSLMPCNLYGVGDNFHAENSHVIPALLRRFHEAKVAGADSVVCWGTGAPLREFLYVDDLAAAVGFVLANVDGPDLLNVGTGGEVTVSDLAQTVARVVGYEGRIEWDTSRPDGTPRKMMDVSRMTALGWRATVGLEDGLRRTYDWYLNCDDARR